MPLDRKEATTLLQALFQMQTYPSGNGPLVSFAAVLQHLETACKGGYAIVIRKGNLAVELPPEPKPKPSTDQKAATPPASPAAK